MNLSRRIVLAAALGLLALGSASAQAPLRIFDAHLHYNQEPNPFYDSTRFWRFSAATT